MNTKKLIFHDYFSSPNFSYFSFQISLRQSYVEDYAAELHAYNNSVKNCIQENALYNSSHVSTLQITYFALDRSICFCRPFMGALPHLHCYQNVLNGSHKYTHSQILRDEKQI